MTTEAETNRFSGVDSKVLSSIRGLPWSRPDRLVVAGQEYEVRWVQGVGESLSRHASVGAVGHSDHSAGFIAVRINAEEASPTQERDTLLHEIVHAVVELTYLPPALKDGERVVSTIATHLLDTLRRNPGLVEYLVS